MAGEAPQGANMARVASMQQYSQSNDGGGDGGGGNVFEIGCDTSDLLAILNDPAGVGGIMFHAFATLSKGIEHGIGFDSVSQNMLGLISPPSVISTIGVPKPGAAFGKFGGQGHGG